MHHHKLLSKARPAPGTVLDCPQGAILCEPFVIKRATLGKILDLIFQIFIEGPSTNPDIG